MGRPRKNAVQNTNTTQEPTTSESKINEVIPQSEIKNDVSIEAPKEVKKRGRKKSIETDKIAELNEAVKSMTISENKKTTENIQKNDNGDKEDKPVEPEKKRRVLKKSIKKEVIENKPLEQNIQDLMKDIDNVNINDFIVDNNLNNQIGEKMVSDNEELNEIIKNHEINVEKYDEKMKMIDNYILNNSSELKNPKNEIGDIMDLKNLENKSEPLYYYLYLHYNQNRDDLTIDYIKTKIFMLGFYTYPRKDENTYFTSEDRKDCIIEKEIQLELSEYPMLDLRVRIIKNTPMKKEIEEDKWNTHLIQYQRTKLEMTLKEVLEKVLNKNTWKYYERKESSSLNLTLERTLNIDNSYFLSRKLNIILGEKKYRLNENYNNLITCIINNL